MGKKQKRRTLSGTTIHEVHRLLGTAFQYAVEWGIIIKSPVPVDSPKKSTQERTIWTVDEMRAALDSMEDPVLHLAVHLTLVGALREGEIVGLTPDDINFDAADGIGTFRINRSMQRVRKEALNQVDDGCIIKIFPDKLERSTTSLILKSTKTASSCRTIFMTSALKEELKKWLRPWQTRRLTFNENRITAIEYCISYQTDRGQITKPFHWKLPQSFRLLQFAIAEYFLLSISKLPE